MSYSESIKKVSKDALIFATLMLKLKELVVWYEPNVSRVVILVSYSVFDRKLTSLIMSPK